MSRIHVLEGSGGFFRVVVHTSVPVGNNIVGTSWSTAIVNSSLNKTALSIGAGAGQITSVEASQISSGTVFEGIFVFADDPRWTNVERAAQVSIKADQFQTQLQSNLSEMLKYYGFTS